MEELIVYLLKSALCTLIFFGIYWCFLRNETFYRFNRYFLLTGIACALLLPFCHYNYTVNMEVPAAISQFPTEKENHITISSIPFWKYFSFAIYTFITSFFMIRHLAGLMKIKRIVLKYGYSLVNGYKIINTPVFQTSFSVFNYIFIDISADTSETERKLILEHELAHVKQYHWADLLTAQLICAMQWFNPFAWQYLRAIKQNHEFLADASVLQQGNSPAQYRAALINHTLKTPVFMFASSFAQYDQLKRVKMMMKTSSNPVRKLSVLLVLPLAVLFLLAFARPEYKVTYIQKNTAAKIPFILRKTAKSPVKTSYTVNRQKAVTNLQPGKITTQENRHHELKLKKATTERMTVTADNDSVKVKIKNTSGVSRDAHPLIFLDGAEHDSLNDVNSSDIESINVYKGRQAIEKYGDKGKDGVIQITTKSKASINLIQPSFQKINPLSRIIILKPSH